MRQWSRLLQSEFPNSRKLCTSQRRRVVYVCYALHLKAYIFLKKMIIIPRAVELIQIEYNKLLKSTNRRIHEFINSSLRGGNIFLIPM